MNRTHRMELEEHTGEDFVFACTEPGCGRRLLMGRDGLVVLNRGDFHAMHSGGTGPAGMTSAVGQR